MLLPEIIARHIARHRDQQLALENSRLRSLVVDLRGDKQDLAKRADAADRRADDAYDALRVFRCEVRTAHAEMLGEIVPLRAENRKLITDLVNVRRDRDGLRSQLDHALGYGADELTAIEAGKTKVEVGA